MPMGDENDDNPNNAAARTTMLVDGGYVNNIPFDIMEELYDPAITIIVNVEATERAQKLRHIVGGEHVSGWWLLLRTVWGVLGFGKGVDLPSAGSVTKEVAGIAAYERLARVLERVENDDEARIVYIEPEVVEYGLLDYHKSEEIIMAGRLAARKALRAWQQRHTRIFGRGRFFGRGLSGASTGNTENGSGGRATPLGSSVSLAGIIAGDRGHSRGGSLWSSMSSDEGSLEGGTFQRKPSFFTEHDKWGGEGGAGGAAAAAAAAAAVAEGGGSLSMETATMSHAKSIAYIHAKSIRQRSPSHLVFSMHNGIDGSIAGLSGGSVGESILTNHSGVVGSSPPVPSRKQLTMRARRTSNAGTPHQVLDKFMTANTQNHGSDNMISSGGNDSNTRRGRTSSGMSGMSDRSRSSSGLSAGGGSERPRVARLHSQLTAAALRDRNMGTSNAVVFSQTTMFSTREYESTDEDDSEDDGLRNAVMF
jgi:hypothetical protein